MLPIIIAVKVEGLNLVDLLSNVFHLCMHDTCVCMNRCK